MQKSSSERCLIHPCFDKGAEKKYARVHLPVAPFCNVQCNFCNRKFDCVNESRPGVTSRLLEPRQVIAYLEKAFEIFPDTAVVGIAGPGDPFASPDLTLETFYRVRAAFPDVHLCVSTNGLNLAPYVSDLRSLKVGYATITINAVYPTIGAKIYSWVRKDGKRLAGNTAAEELLSNQLEALDKLVDAGIRTKVNTVVLPGINLDHVTDIARTAQKMGVAMINCIPLIPVKDTSFETMDSPSRESMKEIRKEVRQYLPSMDHCARCRADAVGFLFGNQHYDTENKLCGNM